MCDFALIVRYKYILKRSVMEYKFKLKKADELNYYKISLTEAV